MPAIEAKYSAAQREAIATAYVDRGVRPASRVVQLAAEGKLTLDGETLDAFDTRIGTVRDAARKLRLRRAGSAHSATVKADPRDAVEALRRRLIALADRELAVLENRRRGTVDPERLRQIARVVREVAALPGPSDPRPPTPGRSNATTQRTGAETTSGLAGSLLKAAGMAAPRVQTREGKTARDLHHTQGTRDSSSAAAHAHEDAPEQQQGEEPGAWARAQFDTQQG